MGPDPMVIGIQLAAFNDDHADIIEKNATNRLILEFSLIFKYIAAVPESKFKRAHKPHKGFQHCHFRFLELLPWQVCAILTCQFLETSYLRPVMP